MDLILLPCSSLKQHTDFINITIPPTPHCEHRMERRSTEAEVLPNPWLDCLQSADYAPRVDLPSDVMSNSATYFGYFTPDLLIPVTVLSKQAEHINEAIKIHELSHVELARATPLGTMTSAFLIFSTVSSKYGSFSQDIGQLMRDVSLWVHESVATFCEFEYLQAFLPAGEHLSNHITRLPPYYRRVLSKIQPVFGAELPEIELPAKVQRMAMASECHGSHQQLLAKMMAFWRSEAARQIGILALEVNLLHILSALSLRNRYRIRLKLLRHAHSPTRRFRSILRALRIPVRLVELYKFFILEFSQLALEASKDGNIEKRGYKVARQGLSADIAQILGLRFPIVAANPARTKKLFRRVGALFPKGSSDRDWWEQDLPGDPNIGEYLLELASQDTAIVPEPWVGRMRSKDDPISGEENRTKNILLTRRCSVRGSTERGVLMAIVNSMDVNSGRIVDRYARQLSEQEMWKLIGSLEPGGANLVVDLGLLKDTVSIERFETLYESFRYTIFFGGIASRSWLNRACEDLLSIFPGGIALIPYGRIAPQATVVILGYVGGHRPLVWSVLGSRLIENLSNYPLVATDSADSALANQLKYEGKSVMEAASSIFSPIMAG